ncbi:MAG: hypothetical protein BWY76_03194 [bacterium ADurb.Bin429]|nr:MAG: hypothetical protein BWY76_03194 [bacterium ADurb.Bin429]
MLAGEGDLVFRAGQLFLKLDEVGAGLQVGIGFHCDHQPVQRAGQGAFRLLALLHGTGGDGGGARLRHRFQRPALVLHIAFYRLHQVRDQVMPPFELHVNLTPGVAYLLAQRDQPIVGGNPPQGDDHQQHDQHEENDAGYGSEHGESPPLLFNRKHTAGSRDLSSPALLPSREGGGCMDRGVALRTSTDMNYPHSHSLLPWRGGGPGRRGHAPGASHLLPPLLNA